MGAVVMCGRAIVRDLYTPVAGARAMSKALTGLGVVACLCAPIGGWLADALGWRSALLALTAYALLTLAMVWRHLPESLPAAQPAGAAPGHLAAHLGRVLRHAHLLGLFAADHGLLRRACSSSWPRPPSSSLKCWGWSAPATGLVLFSTGVAYSLRHLLCRALMARFGLTRTVAIGGLLSCQRRRPGHGGGRTHGLAHAAGPVAAVSTCSRRATASTSLVGNPAVWHRSPDSSRRGLGLQWLHDDAGGLCHRACGSGPSSMARSGHWCRAWGLLSAAAGRDCLGTGAKIRPSPMP